MRTLPILSVAALLCASVPAVGLPTHHRTLHASIRHARTHHSAHASILHDVSIGSERATAIQTALIKSGYLTGEPSGVWDSQSVAAMQKLQGDNGWQTRITPDSRALIKLGLGPQSDAAQPVQEAAANPALQ